MPSSPEREQRANPAKAPPRTEASTCGARHPDSRRDLQKRHGLLSNPGSDRGERPRPGCPLEATGATPPKPEDLGMCSCWLGQSSRTNSQGLSAGSHNLERQAFALSFTGLGPRPKKVSTPQRTGWPGRPAAAPPCPLCTANCTGPARLSSRRPGCSGVTPQQGEELAHGDTRHRTWSLAPQRSSAGIQALPGGCLPLFSQGGSKLCALPG